MNQILKINNSNEKRSKTFFKFQLFFSISIILALLLGIFYIIYSIQISEKESTKLIGNYNIYRLYSNSSNNTSFSDAIRSQILGTIEIPKINLSYPILSTLTEENLKISPCKFYGPNLGEKGNICIAGHNYDNDKFFSNLYLLEINDTIFIYDNSKVKYSYRVFNIYEVKENDFSPLYDYDKNNKELTLLTCNNVNKHRIIVKAIQSKQ